MIIVTHKYACGTTFEYVRPGAGVAAFEAHSDHHMSTCAECKRKAKVKPASNDAGDTSYQVHHEAMP